MSYFLFGNPKRNPIKSKRIMPRLKISKNMFFGQKNWRWNKITIHMDLWKYGQILTIQKSLTIKQLRCSKKIFFIWVYHLILHYILNPNKKFKMWVNIIFSILWCFSQMTNPFLFFFKNSLLLTKNIYINK
jgi:hypothetical protein